MLAMMKKVARKFVTKPYLLNRHISRELKEGEPELRLLSIICRADGEILEKSNRAGAASSGCGRIGALRSKKRRGNSRGGFGPTRQGSTQNSDQVRIGCCD